MNKLAGTSLDVFPLNLGGNVFGFTADETQSHAVLDAYRAAGGNFIDTADSYSHWVPGNTGGESEEIIGSWLAGRSDRDEIVVATKVSQHPDRPGLSAENIIRAAEDSLRRLGTDRIDLYYAHFDDESVPLEETLGSFDELVRSGKVRYLAGSNYSPARVEEALAIQDREGFARWVALQPEYNLVERAEYEQGGRRTIAEREDLAVMPFYSLAHGFLTGKYREAADAGTSVRGQGAAAYLDDRGRRILKALDEVAEDHGVEVASVAIAWLAAQPTITAPLASARTPEQLKALTAGAVLILKPEETERLTAASSPYS